MPQLRRSNLQLYGFVSTVLFMGALLNAFRQRSNFYAAAVYLSKSNACMMVRLPLSLATGNTHVGSS